MTDAARFLSRRERKAIQKKLRRGEAPKAMVPCIHDGRHGLLCSTRTRILFSARKGLGTKVWTWQRGTLKGVAHEKKRYGTVLLKTAKGALRFEMTQRGSAQELLDSLAPPRKAAEEAQVTFRQRPAKRRQGAARTGGSAHRRPSGSRTSPARPARPAPEPDALAHRKTAEHQARLKRMLARGIITKREYEWQTEAR